MICASDRCYGLDLLHEMCHSVILGYEKTFSMSTFVEGALSFLSYLSSPFFFHGPTLCIFISCFGRDFLTRFKDLSRNYDHINPL